MAIITARYNDKMPIGETYQEIYSHLATMKNEEVEVDVAGVKLDLANSACSYGGVNYPLNDRAIGMLCDRLRIGRLHEMLSPATYKSVEAELQDHIDTLPGQLKLKHKNGVVNAVVSGKYKELPYDESVRVLEDVGARPIRVTTNDAILKVQAIFGDGQFSFTPKDGQEMSLGVQMQSSDVGASSLQFDVFTYRWICQNGMVMGKNSLFKFRNIHIMSRDKTAAAVDSEIKRVLTAARGELKSRIDRLINTKVDRQAVVKFLAAQPLGKKALGLMAEKVVEAKNMYGIVNALTLAGHDPDNSASLQATFELAAGELMMLSVA
jgi:hypothetical protein